MSQPSWRSALDRTLNRLAERRARSATGQPLRVAVVGIGHELRGDDGAGVAVARFLQMRPAQERPFLVVDAGCAPENHVGPLRRFHPDLVLLVDAADMGEPAGAVRWLAWEETTGLSASTHTLPPHVLARYLTAEIGCEVALVGIQPADTAIGAPLSAAAQQAVEEVARGLEAALQSLGEGTWTTVN
jgi:hydrogenase 3 maturation protease